MTTLSEEQKEELRPLQALVGLFLVAVVVISTLLLTGCVHMDDTLVNDKGHTARCRGTGGGIIGSLVATANHESCLSMLREKGYK